MKNTSFYGPDNNLPLDISKAHIVSLVATEKLTIESEITGEDISDYWIILYEGREALREFLRIKVIVAEILEYTSDKETEIIVTHWKKQEGIIVQCDLTIE